MDDRYIIDARRRRAELARNARWADASAVVREIVHRTTASGDAIGNLVYVPGGAEAEAAAVEGAAGFAADARADVVEAMLLANAGTDRRQAVSLALRSLEESRREDVYTFWCALMTLIHADEFTLADRECSLAASQPFWTRLPSRRHLLSLLRGRMLALSGKLREARQALSRLVCLPSGPGELAAIWLIEVFAEVGDVGNATDLLHSHGMLGSIEDGRDRPLILAVRGAVEFAAGRFEQGLDNLLACGRELSAWSVFNPAVVNWRSRAALCASALQQCDLATSLAQEDLLHARSWGTPWARGAALHALGLARCDEHGAQHLRESVAAIFQGATQSERIRVCFDLGLYLWRRLSYEDARKMLTLARDLADSCGSVVWSERSRVALGKMSGETAGSVLTEREALIGSFARAGLSNKEIAERANLTVRTVEQHLSSAYRKLGISGRADMAYAMVNPCFSAG